jgi:hypothetical protein
MMKLMIPVMVVMMVLFGVGVMAKGGASGNHGMNMGMNMGMGSHCMGMGGHDGHSSGTHDQHVASGANPGAVKSNVYGKTIPADMVVTTVNEILADPQALEGKDVLVAGKITSECPSGGWIWVQDASGQVYVNMHPTNVFIPQHVGKMVRAMGKVVLESGQPSVVGYGLELN